MSKTPEFFAQSAQNVVKALQSDAARGLNSSDISARREAAGFNELKEAPPVPAWKKFLRQFNNLVVWILIAASMIAGATQDWIDTAAIMAIVILNGVLGFLQEERAEQALASLRKLSAPMAKVNRDGRLQTIPARELVPGDVIELEAGDHVPADARLLESFSLRIQEASLTGESLPSEKQANDVLPEETPLGDRKNMIYMSTVVAAGKGTAVVTATGMETELGHIAGLLSAAEAEPTPLQRRLEELGRILVYICLAIVAVIFVLELVRGGKLLDIVLRAVSLAVAAVPEGLPAVVTMALALGLQRLVKRNVLIRKLPSVETLGSVSVICSDKTGTLTRNEMTVRVMVAGGEWYDVSGSGYEPLGEFTRRAAGSKASSKKDESSSSSNASAVTVAEIPDLQRAIGIGVRCNHARLNPPGSSKDPAKEGSRTNWEVIGDPTEGALLVTGKKANLNVDDGKSESRESGIVFEIPFDSDRKMMSVVVKCDGGKAEMLTKGAPEEVLSKCVSELRNGKSESLTEARRKEILQLNSEMAAQALRVLGLAFREEVGSSQEDRREEKLVFAGLAGMIDPPREEAKVAVQKCQRAGIRPVMITGDHPATAGAIARELGISSEATGVLSGPELDKLSEEELIAAVEKTSVYARVSPEHKLRVVQAWRQRGQVVAMTGDGVNDAPAVKAADIGIAMGITGTDVTKSASDMVLTDDNFASIVGAVEEGRGIFDNIRKFVHYLLSCNAGEVLVMFVAALFGWPAPLAAVQLLWINLVTDGLPALALGMEPTEPDVMERPPRPSREPVITWSGGLHMLAHGSLIAAATITGFLLIHWQILPHPANADEPIPQEVAHAMEEQANASHDATTPQVTDESQRMADSRAKKAAFCIMAFSQLFFSIGCRSHKHTMPQLGLFSNPYLIGAIAVSGLLQLAVVLIPFLRPFFEVQATLTGLEWGVILALSLAPATAIELEKLIRNSLHPAAA